MEPEPFEGTPVPWGGGPLVFVGDLDRPRLADDDLHHLTRVRRLRDGDHMVLGDGDGRWRTARFAGAEPDVTGPVLVTPRPAPEIGVAFALVKGQKPELVVQKLTELGVDRIVPFVAARSVVRWDATKADAAEARLTKVAREAARQSRRAWLPVVEQVTNYAEVAARPGVARADEGGAPISLATPLVMVGPEGGWDDAERLPDQPVVTLSDAVLRAETAAIAAGVLLASARMTQGATSPS